MDGPQNLSHPATASPTNEAIDNMLETIKYGNIRDIINEMRKEIELIIAQKLKPLLENSESSIKSAKETSRPAIACSKLTIETLEQGVKYVQS